jgi:hypothetical protein
MNVWRRLLRWLQRVPAIALRTPGRKPWQLTICSVVILSLLFALALWKIPQHEVAPLTKIRGLSQVTVFDEEDKARVTLAQILGGAILLAGLGFTWWRIEIGRQGQLTERFIRAVEQLSNDGVSVRVGGIYALARVAKESNRDRTAVIDLLAVFVREHAPRGGQFQTLFVQPDVQAALTVLGQTIDISDFESSRQVDLSNTHLPGAKLRRGNFYCIDLSGSNLRGAQMEQAQLREARLWSACLDLANLSGADLSYALLEEASAEDADFSEAILTSADFSQANLKGADFSDADMAGAALRGTHLEGATLDQIIGEPLPFADLFIDDRTRLPKSSDNWVMKWIRTPKTNGAVDEKGQRQLSEGPGNDAEDAPT